MYSSYFYGAGATPANILADAVAILTGETTVANLSASCDKVNTTIDASIAVAGWTLFDAAAGTNAVCLRAPVADSASQYKYLLLSTNTSGYIIATPYETWNPDTHTGTGMAYYGATVSYAQRINTTSGGRLDVYSKGGIYWAFSLQGGVFGSSTGSGPSGLLERSRKSPWDTVENGYPPFMFFSNYSFAYEPRSLNASGTDITGSATSLEIINAFGAGNLATSSVPGNASKTLKHQLVAFGVCKAANGHQGGDISSICDIWLTTHGNGSSFDTLTVDGKTYVIWAVGNAQRFAVRKG